MTTTPHGQVPEALEDFEVRKLAAIGAVSTSSGLVERRPIEYRRELEDQFVRGFRAAEKRLSALSAAPTITPETGNSASAKGAAITSESGAVYAPMPRAAYIEFDGREETAWHTPDQMRDFADRTYALRMQQAAPKAAPGVGNSGFDHQTAADFLSGKPVNDEAVRKFVAASRWAHDERASLSATLLAMHGVLTSREAEIALLKQALLEAEAAPQPAPAPLSDDTKRLDWLDRNIFSREMSEWDAKYGHGPDYNMWVVFSPKGVQGSARNIIDAAIAAQRDTP